MNRPRPGQPLARAFTLIELIGVLAIIAILAGTLAPNVLRSLDRAAIRAERTTAEKIGEQALLYLRQYRTPPTMTDWASQLARFADLSPADLRTNSRGIDRIFVLDNAANPAPRAMVISSMRRGLPLPPAYHLANPTRFSEVWDTPDGRLPPATSWSGWNTWAGVANSADYLVIERINFLPVYATEFRSFSVTINNLDTNLVAYRVTDASGVAGATTTLPGGGSVILSNLHTHDRIDLFNPGNFSTVAYSYILSDTGKTFDFDGTQWTPQ
ncbi:MAG: type II secretion system protein [Verrucomicrobia bacterium]|nr:MAG: type II secretion system protein [Verrucomicrobiota bacterium]